MAELDNLMQERLATQLLAFGQAPGRFAVHLGEPALLHNQMDTVVAWALGRTPDAWTERAQALTDAAVLFVLRSCFTAHNNLYQVLGLRNRQFGAGELKARYRALIRLAHPDMNVKGLPPNASALVNRAYEVLGNAEARTRYDAELANASAVAVMLPPMGYQPPPRYRAELQTEAGWGERLHALTARHPTLVRNGLVSFGVVLVALLLIWAAASDNHDSRMLVAGGMPGSTSNRKAVVPEINQTQTPVQAGTAKTAPVRPAAPTVAANNPATAPVKANLTLPAFESLPAPAPLGKPGMAAPATVAVAPATSPAPQVSATPTKPTPNAAPTPATPASTATATAQQAAATVVQAAPPPPQTWPVDVNAAKQFLTSVLNALENPGYARQVNASLDASKVKGNLLAPALQRLKGAATIERMGWTETTRPGVMQVLGYVELAPDGAERTDTPRVRFVVSSEFVGTKDGTAMTTLALKDDTPPASQPVALAPKPAPPPPPAQTVPPPKVATPAAVAPAAATVTKAATPTPTAAAQSATPAPAAAAPTPAPAATEAAAPPAPVWPVDVAKSKAFLTSILNALESPQQTRQVANHLAGLNVKGSLLRAVQQRVGDAKASVDRIGLTDTQKPGTMVVQGHVVLTPERPDGSGGPLRFAVVAEFVGTKDGTAMAALSLKEEP
jgi:hypothetical protein